MHARLSFPCAAIWEVDLIHSSDPNPDSAERRYRLAEREARDAKWIEMWRELNPTWQGLSNNKKLCSYPIRVPDHFPSHRPQSSDGRFTNLQDYWRWSLGVDEENRLLSDEEMFSLGLLVDVDGEIYHLLHAPDDRLKEEGPIGPEDLLIGMIGERAEVTKQLMSEAAVFDDFERAVQLQGAWIELNFLNEISYTFDTQVRLSYARLPQMKFVGEKLGSLKFDFAYFCDSVDFSGTTFSGTADFSESTFKQKASFSRTTFAEPVNLSEAVFNRPTDFRGAKFQRSSNLSAVYHGDVDFSGCEFSEQAEFRVSFFASSVSFSRAKFQSETFFSDAIFEDDAEFKEAAFFGDTDFSEARSKGKLSFIGCRFLGNVDFHNFNWPPDEQEVSFQFSEFAMRVIFSGNDFHHVEALNQTLFHVQPTFSKPSVGYDYLFERSHKRIQERITRHNKGRADWNLRRSFKMNAWEALAGGYRTLKLNASHWGDSSLQQRYYRYELRTRVKSPDAPWWEKLAARLYSWSSDYGSSISRPILALVFLLLMFGTIYFALAISIGVAELSETEELAALGWQSWEFSWNNVFRPLSALATEAPREGDASRLAGKLLYDYGGGFAAVVRAVATLQSLLGVILAFLFGLSLRRRFQIE